MRKIRATTILIPALMAFLVACGPSDEKLSEAENARNALLQAKEAAYESYLDITDSSKKARLEELEKQVEEIEETDFTKLSDKKIDEVLPTITSLTEEYQSLQTGFAEILDEETKEKELAEQTVRISVYLSNKTEKAVHEVMLHDLTKDTYSDNLLADSGALEAGYTLMGVVLDVDKDSTDWEIVFKDESGTTNSVTAPDLLNSSSGNLAIVLETVSEG